MQPLGTFDLVLNFFIVVIMPALIWANLRPSVVTNAPLNVYLWREHANFMRVSLVILAMLTVFSAITLLEHYGLVSYNFGSAAGLVIGVPFLVLAVAEIWLAITALLKYWRSRAGAGG